MMGATRNHQMVSAVGEKHMVGTTRVQQASGTTGGHQTGMMGEHVMVGTMGVRAGVCGGADVSCSLSGGVGGRRGVGGYQGQT